MHCTQIAEKKKEFEMGKSKYKNKQERLPENDKNNVAFYKKKSLDQEKTKDETETRETRSENITI